MNDLSARYYLGTHLISRSLLARGNEKLNTDFFQGSSVCASGCNWTRALASRPPWRWNLGGWVFAPPRESPCVRRRRMRLQAFKQAELVRLLGSLGIGAFTGGGRSEEEDGGSPQSV